MFAAVRRLIATLLPVLLGAAALCASASAAATTVAIKVTPSRPHTSSRVQVTVSGAIGAPGTFEVADYQARAGSKCAQALTDQNLEFGHKISHVLGQEGPFSFQGSFLTALFPTEETLCAVVFPDPGGVLHEENSEAPVVPSAIAELRYPVGAAKAHRRCVKRRHGRCVRYKKK